MQYIFLLLEIAIAFWLVLNIYQSIIAFCRSKHNQEEGISFLNFLIERLQILGRTFVYTIVYAVIAIGILYIIYEFGLMIFG